MPPSDTDDDDRTTVPPGPPSEDRFAAYRQRSWGLVLLWSATQPHRIGEIAMLPDDTDQLVGSGTKELDDFAHFIRHRPREPLAPFSRAGLLVGEGISPEHLSLCATESGVDLVAIGRCPTFVNDVETTCGMLKEGDTVRIGNEALLLCVRRPVKLLGPAARHVFRGPDANGIVGESPAAWLLRQQLAPGHLEPYIGLQGESGTGKTLFAGAIHRDSERAESPLITCDTTTFSSRFPGIELCGNVAYYPGADMVATSGLLERARDGTLLLEAIDDCPVPARRCIRAMMDKSEFIEFYTFGASTSSRVEVRIIVTSRRDLDELDHDLSARILQRIRIPPLRERREDIPLLIRHWLLRRAQQRPELERRFVRIGATGEMEPRVSVRLVDHLVRHPLPLNVLQLNHFLAEALDASAGDEVLVPSSLLSGG